MKYIFIYSLFVFCSVNALAQAKPITFNAAGIAIGAQKGDTVMPVEKSRKMAKGPAFKLNSANTDPVNSFKLNLEEKKKLKKEIAEKFEKTLDNLQDDNLKLKAIYDVIWGNGETDKIIKEYQAFLQYLNDETGTAASHDAAVSGSYIPKPSEFERRVFNAPVYTEVDNNSGKEYDMRKLIFTNPYKHFILSYLEETTTETTSRIDLEKINIEYKKGWRELEDTYSKTAKLLSKIKDSLGSCVAPACTDDYDTIVRDLKNITGGRSNYILALLRKPFFKKWLWYNEGFLFMNPLVATTKDKRYPLTEKVSMLSDGAKGLAFSDSTQSKMLDSIFTTRNVKNEVLIAKEINTGRKKTIDRYYYDAAEGYKSLNEKALPKAKDNNRGIAVVAYNVPANERLTFSLEKSKDTPDMGAVAQSIIDAGTTGSLSSILSGAESWITAWKKVSSDFNVKSAVPHPKLIDAPDLKKALIRNEKNITTFRTAKRQSQKMHFYHQQGFNGDFEKSTPSNGQESEFWKDFIKNSKTDFVATINRREFVATKNSDTDKVIFINAYLLKEDSKNCNSCFGLREKCLIDTFIVRDLCYALNYEGKKEFDKGVYMLLERFKCYSAEIDTCRKKLSDYYDEIANTYLPKLKAYISIIQRSLPPVLTKKAHSDAFYKQELISKDTAEYRTEIFEKTNDDLPEPPKKIVYEVISSLPGKIADGKQVTPNVVIQHSYRYSKRHWIDFSAGLAFMPTDYTIKSVDGGLPKVSEGDKFRPIAGMRIYPFGGLLKVDDRARPQLSRLSLYFGLGLTKALENFYPGISYDIVPGMRTVVGYHLYKDTRYTILNNQVIDQASSYKGSGIFVSISMEPKAFATFIGLIK